MKILDKINNDADVKKLDKKEIKLLANEIRELIIKTSETNPIHLSSNLGIIELTLGIMMNFDLSNDKVLYDTGHQTYVHKILTGRWKQFHTIRKDDGLKGFMNMDESIYDHYSPGHSGNILSIASGMYQKDKAINKDPKKQKYFNNKNIVAVVGDSALSNGLSFEALNDIAFNKESIIIILNDNGMSISQSVGALSCYTSTLKNCKLFHFIERGCRHIFDYNKLYYSIFKIFNYIESKVVPKNLFQNLGFNYIGPIDGNDINKINKGLIRAKWFAKQGPVIIHIKTIKGSGHKIAEQDKQGHYHSYSSPTKKIDKSFGIYATEHIMKLMEKDENIFVINPAMTRSSNCEIIQEKYPNRFLDVGIAEEHAISKASGMALQKLKPIVYIYSSFLQRAYDQLLHDCSRLKLPITLLIDRADSSGGDGPTHHGVYDIGFLKTIENTIITSPRNINQLYDLIDISQKNKHNIFAIRYSKWYFSESIINKEHKVIQGEWEWFEKYKTDTIIISYGPYINKIYDEIIDQNKVNLINAIYITGYQEKEILKVLNKYKNIIVYERIKNNNGLVADFYYHKSKLNYKNNIIEMNYYNKPLDHGSTNVLDQKAHMSIQDIINKIKSC